MNNRLRRLDVRRLKSHVINKTQMHELSFEMQRKILIQRKCRTNLTTPVSISGATSPAALAMANQSRQIPAMRRAE